LKTKANNRNNSSRYVKCACSCYLRPVNTIIQIKFKMRGRLETIAKMIMVIFH